MKALPASAPLRRLLMSGACLLGEAAPGTVCLCRLRRSNGGRRAVQRDALQAYRLFQIDRTGQTSSETSLALPPFANSARPSLAELGKIWSVMTARP